MAYVDAKAFAFSKDQIVVALSPGLFGGHLGVAFHSPHGPKLLHLAFHRKVVTEDFPPTRACWIAAAAKVHPINAKFVGAVVKAISENKPEVNFGLNIFASNGSFDHKGNYTAPPGSDGLTCATFVAQIFADAGLPIVDITTWKPRDEDIAWGNAVCDELRDANATQEHIDTVRANITGLRVRPEEVAYAAVTSPWPVDFSIASSGGVDLRDTLQTICPHEPPIAFSYKAVLRAIGTRFPWVQKPFRPVVKYFRK